jgi:DNA (cytosine-5)-methyltransferase 1
LDAILGHLASFGYDAEWHCIPASAVGAPHRRDRIWIIATDAGGEQHKGGRTPISGEIAEELSRATAYAAPVFGPEIVGDESDGVIASTGPLADADREGLAIRQSLARNDGEELASAFGANWWASEPDVGRVADGVPSRVDRLGSLGNAVVPLIPKVIGKAIIRAIL